MHNRGDAEIERELRFVEEDRLEGMRADYLWWEKRDPMGVPAPVLELNPDIGKEAA